MEERKEGEKFIIKKKYILKKIVTNVFVCVRTILLVEASSNSFWSYSEIAATKITAVTPLNGNIL